MLSSEGCKARRARLWNELVEVADVILVCEPRHVSYLTGFYASPFEFRSVNAAAFALLTREGATLYADNVLAPYAEQAHVDRVVQPVWYEGKRSAPHRRGLLCRELLSELVRRGPRVACDAASTPFALIDALTSQRPDSEIIALEPILSKLERHKDPDEVTTMLRAIRAGEAGHAAALAETRAGMSEHDLYRLVHDAAQRALGHTALVYGDFVTGPRTVDIGGPPSSRLIEAADLVLLDFSVVVQGYRGDFANTFVCDGEPSAEQTRLFEACQAALSAGERLLRAGAVCREIDGALRSTFEALGCAATFKTHSGHGLGLGHPNPPYIVAESNDSLEAGDIVTLEPGQYVPGVGGMRYERNYLVTETGYELLTQHTISLTQP